MYRAQIAAASFFVVLAWAPCSAAHEVAPVAYDITLVPNADSGVFTGSERIEVDLTEPQHHIRLDSVGLSVATANVTSNGTRSPVAVHAVRGGISLHGPFPAGRTVIELSWAGHLTHTGRGFYVTTTPGPRYVFTQLEPSGARSVFPCFDEPALRARFTIRTSVPAGDDAISNGAKASEALSADRNTKTIVFTETPPISAYLVSLAVGRFERIEAWSGSTLIGVYARPDEIARAAAALVAARELLPRFERYLGVAYPFAKLDFVAAQELAPYAMENAGAIFVRGDELLIDEKPSLISQQIMNHRIAHELAHQWFGDLVTVSSWNDLWLKEGLARWAEFEIIGEAHPDWHVWDTFRDRRDRMFAADDRVHTHALADAATAHGAPAFDPITYDKGAATLRMLEHWMGPESFRAALHDYLRDKAFGVARASDLWRSFAARAGAPVVELARSWIEQPGFPEVTLTAHCDHGVLDVSARQHPAAAYRSAHARVRWQVPVEITTSSTPLRFLLQTNESRVRLRDPAGCTTRLDSIEDLDAPFRMHIALPHAMKE